MTTTKISAPSGIDAVYYMVKDVARARKFYEEGLGFQPTFVAESGGGTVEDVKAATERVREFGGKVNADTFDTPVCAMSWCEDTEGNTFCLHHRKDGTVG